jgi:hypothetical protein
MAKRLTRAEILDRHKALRLAVFEMFQARAALEAFPLENRHASGLAFLETLDAHDASIQALRKLMLEQD